MCDSDYESVSFALTITVGVGVDDVIDVAIVYIERPKIICIRYLLTLQILESNIVIEMINPHTSSNKRRGRR